MMSYSNAVSGSGSMIEKVFTYDTNGNTLEEDAEGVITSYTYDERNRMTNTSGSGYAYDSAYNAEGYRTKKTVTGSGAGTTQYLYEYDKVVLEMNAQGTETGWNVYGDNTLLYRKAGGTTLYYLYNGHGDVTALVNSSGTIVASYYYDAFGVVTDETGGSTATNNSYRYSGYQYDKEGGLYYLNSRYYDPEIARFMSQDTYTGNARDPLSLNLYTYCYNNPIRYYDPTGYVVTQADIDNAYANNPPDVAKAIVDGIAAATDDYNNAETDEQRAAAHAEADRLRGITTSDGTSSGAGGNTILYQDSSDRPALNKASTLATIYTPNTKSADSTGYTVTQGYIANGLTYLSNGSIVQNGTVVSVGSNYYKLGNGKGVPTHKPTNLFIAASDAIIAGMKMSTSAAPMRNPGYYMIKSVYGWYSKPDLWEFGASSDTYMIISDVNNRWSAATVQAKRDKLYGIAEDVRRLYRDTNGKHEYMYGQVKVMDIFHANAKTGLAYIESLLANYWFLADGGDPYTASYSWFVGMTENAWDYKFNPDWQIPYERFNGYNMSIDNNRNWMPWIYFEGEMWGADKIGNMNLGYVGTKMGYPKQMLLIPLITDDKGDGHAITFGISLAKSGR
jgi:RHS repeat-associated protein